jgi:hypothetical protein
LPKKKSVKRSARAFVDQTNDLMAFCQTVDGAGLSAQHITWAYELALIKLSAHFEHLILHALVGAINNNTGTLSATTGVVFPEHLTDEVCEYLIIRNGYFDFRGRDGLIDLLKRFVPDTHYLVQAVKKPKQRAPLELMLALRNFAAHESRQAKKAALEALGTKRVASAGSWVKRQRRFSAMATSIKALAGDIEAGAPY